MQRAVMPMLMQVASVQCTTLFASGAWGKVPVDTAERKLRVPHSRGDNWPLVDRLYAARNRVPSSGLNPVNDHVQYQTPWSESASEL
jgi:hypothetical protein